jgi:hypothetical protein
LDGTVTVGRFDRTAAALHVAGTADGEGVLLLPQFWSAGWQVTGAEISVDRTTGLIRLTVRNGAFDVTVARGPTPYAMTGVGVTATALVVLGSLTLRRRRINAVRYGSLDGGAPV